MTFLTVLLAWIIGSVPVSLILGKMMYAMGDGIRETKDDECQEHS